jgi:hypothetical protein
MALGVDLMHVGYMIKCITHTTVSGRQMRNLHNKDNKGVRNPLNYKS